ncbi:CYFA0S25e00914g1_1 [Cyberlindnera fabianii]|uniref:Signal peptidase complex subunit 2 n=1 Tax=Cyberlindnera fabianii TaxID=36022 RepID=A0A061B9R6_CYBFA|nr:Signal peptidase complex subunit SPC2 [Cyberlindnera fabianii]CDR46684.1 CYFA0S25e00914g1_1 [Cyberlindnera fabianii]
MLFKTAKPHSVVDLKTVTNERLPLAMATLGYIQDHRIGDVNIIIGYTIAVIAGITFYLEKKMTWTDALPYTKLLVGAYWVVCVVSWFHTKFVERDIVFKGYTKDKKKEVTISGTVDKYIPEYNLTIISGAKGATPVTKKVTLEFKDIFDKFGNLHESELASWFKAQLDDADKQK